MSSPTSPRAPRPLRPVDADTARHDGAPPDPVRPGPVAGGPLEERLRRWVVAVFPRDAGPQVAYDAPAGDPGLFGPGSVTWRIHADLPGMLAGGLGALMLQTLHPLALAGVWDHSDFRRDLVGRLRRTTAFVAATSYAPRAEAERMIGLVRGIHARVRGRAPDGRPYSADDPRLLTWVHVTEAMSFLRGFEAYGPMRPGAAQIDAYYAESARVAEALGARDVPRSHAEVQAFLGDIRPELAWTARSAEVLQVLAAMRLPVPAGGLGRELFLGAGAAILPEWARAMIPRGPLARARDAAAAATLKAGAGALRRAMREGIAPRACVRMGLEPAALLQRWPGAGERAEPWPATPVEDAQRE
jgi:uncharacterized protein (DUF2236 family)